MAELQVSVVTPEATVLETKCDGVTLPMFDGQAGVLAGHSPLIGRLSPGELRINNGTAVQRFYVDGGFVQIADDHVSVLTGRSIPVADIDVNVAKADLEKAQAMEGTNAEFLELKKKAIAQANAQIRMVEKA